MSMNENKLPPQLTEHQLKKFKDTRDDSLVWRCSVCHQLWSARPSRPCPGVKVYPYNQRPDHLRTSEELKTLHLVPTGPVIGASELGSGPSRRWVWLYDKGQSKLTPLPKAALYLEGYNIRVYFPYHRQLVAELRKLPGASFSWKDRYWYVPAKHEELLRQTVRKYFAIEGEEELPLSLRPMAEIRQAVVEAQAIKTTRAASLASRRRYTSSTSYDFVYATVTIDDSFLIWPKTGQLNTSFNGGFEVLEWSGSYLEGKGEYCEPYKVRYSVTVRTRAGASWQVRSRYRNSSLVKASFEFVGEPRVDLSQLAGSPAEFDIELGEVDEALANLPDSKYAVELEEQG